MTTATETLSVGTAQEVEFVTFHVGDILIGADIRQVESINRHVEVTTVHVHFSSGPFTHGLVFRSFALMHFL